MVWGCWAAPGAGGLHHITGIMTFAKNPANHQEEERKIYLIGSYIDGYKKCLNILPFISEDIPYVV